MRQPYSVITGVRTHVQPSHSTGPYCQSSSGSAIALHWVPCPRVQGPVVPGHERVRQPPARRSIDNPAGHEEQQSPPVVHHYSRQRRILWQAALAAAVPAVPAAAAVPGRPSPPPQDHQRDGGNGREDRHPGGSSPVMDWWQRTSTPTRTSWGCSTAHWSRATTSGNGRGLVGSHVEQTARKNTSARPGNTTPPGYPL